MFLQGTIFGMDNVQMERTNKASNWLSSKYGKPVSVWETQVQMKNQHGDAAGQFLQGHNVAFEYSYMKKVRGS